MKKLMFLIPVLMLTGCSTYQEGFDCAAVPGVGCKSITQVDRLIDQGKIGVDEALPFESKSLNPQPLSPRAKGVQAWLAPYEDENGTWHDSQTLFVPLERN